MFKLSLSLISLAFRFRMHCPLIYLTIPFTLYFFCYHCLNALFPSHIRNFLIHILLVQVFLNLC
jgi:hypothetical protein